MAKCENRVHVIIMEDVQFSIISTMERSFTAVVTMEGSFAIKYIMEKSFAFINTMQELFAWNYVKECTFIHSVRGTEEKLRDRKLDRGTQKCTTELKKQTFKESHFGMAY